MKEHCALTILRPLPALVMATLVLTALVAPPCHADQESAWLEFQAQRMVGEWELDVEATLQDAKKRQAPGDFVFTEKRYRRPGLRKISYAFEADGTFARASDSSLLPRARRRPFHLTATPGGELFLVGEGAGYVVLQAEITDETLRLAPSQNVRVSREIFRRKGKTPDVPAGIDRTAFEPWARKKLEGLSGTWVLDVEKSVERASDARKVAARRELNYYAVGIESTTIQKDTEFEQKLDIAGEPTTRRGTIVVRADGQPFLILSDERYEAAQLTREGADFVLNTDPKKGRRPDQLYRRF